MSSLENPETQCRTCLQHQKEYHHLEDYVEINLQIIEMLDAIVPQIHIRIPIGISPTICFECSEQLLKSYKFQKMCMESNNHLIDLFEKRNKLSSSGKNVGNILDPLKSIDMKVEDALSDSKRFEQECYLKDNLNSKYLLDYDELKEECSNLEERALNDIPSNSSNTCSKCGRRFKGLNSLRKHEVVHQKSQKHKIFCDKNMTNDGNFSCKLCLEEFGELHLLVEHTKIHLPLLKKPNVKKKKLKEIKYLYDEESESEIRNKKNNLKNSNTSGYTKPKEIKEIKQEEDVLTEFPINDSKIFDRSCRFKRLSSMPCSRKKHHETQKKNKSNNQITAESFNCPDCPRLFETLALLSAHRQIHAHLAPDANFSCSFCQFNFVSEKSLIEHITSRHPEVEKHQCNQCEKKFILSTHLSEHLKRHRDSKEHLVCAICDKEFSYKNTLKEHMRSHKNENSFLCPQCGKTFKTSSNLSQHMKRHFGLKQYLCPECPSRFNCRSDLIKHMSTHRMGKPHECDVCGSRFTRAYSLRKHKTLHTGEKRYKCGECFTAFATTDHLRRHMRTHTGEKPYKCKFCDRTFAESGDLTKHIRKHIGQNTYMCDQCPMSFKYNAELRRHVSEHFTKAQMQRISNENVKEI